MECTGDEALDAPRHWRVGLAYQRLVSELAFGSDVVDLRMDSVAAGLEWRPGGAFALQLGAGALVDGRLAVRGESWNVSPGWVVSVSGSWTAVPEGSSSPFVSLSAALGASGARTTRQGRSDVSFLALDARFAVIAGKTLWRTWVPYLAGRVFGGPVFWKIAGDDVTGGDRHHYQLGLGSAVLLPRGFDLLVEWMPLGARSFTAGLGLAF